MEVDASTIVTALLVVAVSAVLALRLSNRNTTSAKDSSPRRQKRMTVMGNVTLASETLTNKSIPQAVIRLSRSMTVAEWVDLLKKKVLNDPLFDRYCSIVHEGHFIYLENFDPSVCIREVSLDASDTIHHYVNKVTNSPLDDTKPLWEIHLINQQDKCFLLWRNHHCIGDGRSLSWAFLKLTDEFPMIERQLLHAKKKKQDAKKETTAPVPAKKEERVPSKPKEEKAGLLLQMWRILTKLFSVYVIAEPATLLKRKGGEKKNVAWSHAVTVSAVKAVGRNYNATVNDVMMTCVAGSLRKFLEKNDPASIAKANTSRRPLSIRAAMPIDLRPADDIITSLGNNFSSLLIPLAIGIEDPAERLLAVKKQLDMAKNSIEKHFSFALSMIMGKFTPAFLVKLGLQLFTRNVSVAVSNVRVADIPFHICERSVELNVGFVPPPPQVNVGVAIMSIGDDLMVSILVDDNVTKNAGQLVDYLVEDFRELERQTALRFPEQK